MPPASGHSCITHIFVHPAHSSGGHARHACECTQRPRGHSRPRTHANGLAFHAYSPHMGTCARTSHVCIWAHRLCTRSCVVVSANGLHMPTLCTYVWTRGCGCDVCDGWLEWPANMQTLCLGALAPGEHVRPRTTHTHSHTISCWALPCGDLSSTCPRSVIRDPHRMLTICECSFIYATDGGILIDPHRVWNATGTWCELAMGNLRRCCYSVHLAVEILFGRCRSQIHRRDTQNTQNWQHLLLHMAMCAGRMRNSVDAYSRPMTYGMFAT